MIERGRTLRLLEEALEIAGIGMQLRRHALDSDAPFQRCVFGGVDLPHAARSTPTANQEATDSRARQIVGNRRRLELIRWLCHEDEVTRRTPLFQSESKHVGDHFWARTLAPKRKRPSGF